MRTAAALLLLDVSPSSINFELRRQHGLTEGEAALVIREAAQLEQRAERRRTTRRRPGR